MSEETPLIKQTLRATAWMLLPTALFLAMVSVAALAVAPASKPRTEAPEVHPAGGNAAPTSAPAAAKVQTKI